MFSTHEMGSKKYKPSMKFVRNIFHGDDVFDILYIVSRGVSKPYVQVTFPVIKLLGATTR